MTFEVVLVRHGAVDSQGCCYGQRHDVGLSVEGQRQAEAAATRVGSATRVVSSPALRATATAAAWGVTPVVDPRWSERDFGSWESRPWAECWAEAPDALTGIDAYVAYTPPGGEPLGRVATRVVQALEELEEPTVVVTHGGPIRIVLRQVLALSWAQAFAIDPEPGTVTRLVRHGDSWIVRCVGC